MPMTPTGLPAAARMRTLRQQISRLHEQNSFLLHLQRRRIVSPFSTIKPTTSACAAPKSSASSTSAKRALSNTASHSTPPTSAIPPAGSASPKTIPIPAAVPQVPIWQRLGPLTWAIQGFGRSQRKRPYLTQFISTLVIYFLGDMSAQAIRMQDERGKLREAQEQGLDVDGEGQGGAIGEGRYEPERTAKALIIGAGSSIPTYLWFIHLSTHYNYPSLILSLATKVGINQLLYTPLFNSYFFGMQSILTFVPFLNRSPSANLHHKDLFSREGWEHVRDHVKKTVPTSFVNSCKLWPAVTAVNFWVVPVDFRAVTAGVVAVGWQTYLSFLNRRVEREEEKEEGGLEGVLERMERQGLSSSLVSNARMEESKGREGKK